MKTLKKIILLLCGVALVGLFSACKDQGPAESVGEKIDETIEETQKNVEETGEQMQAAADEASEEMQEAADEAGERMEEAGEKMQNQ